MTRIVFLFGMFWLGANVSSFPQTCETIDGRTLNCVDKQGRRQGLWWEMKEDIFPVADRGYCSAEGQYRDGRKTGVWRYYDESEKNREEKQITYYADGSVWMKDLRHGLSMGINADSSRILGNTLAGKDTIRLSCRERQCVFVLLDGKEITSFPYKDYNVFEFETVRLHLGIYDRRIRELKAMK